MSPLCLDQRTLDVEQVDGQFIIILGKGQIETCVKSKVTLYNTHRIKNRCE